MKTKSYLQNTTLNEQMDILVEKIDAERKRIQKVNSQIEAYKIQNIEQQKKVGGVDAIQETSRMIDKTRKIIEARLNQSLVKFDEHVDQNRNLRKQIDDLRQERVVYDSIYKKLERELQIKATEMKRIVEEGRTMIISKERAMSEVQERDGLKDGIELEHAANESQSTIDLDASNDFNCNETITKIKDATGFASVDEIINQLSEVQNKIFSLFNYCSDATAEIEGLETKLAETRADMEQYKSRIKKLSKEKSRTSLQNDPNCPYIFLSALWT